MLTIFWIALLCSMILQGVLFIFLFGVLDVGICSPVENEPAEKIDPVNLSYFCFNLAENEKNITKSPILLLHGITANSGDWNNIYETLAVDTGRKVCAVDLRNHGDSEWNDRSDVEAMTVDIEHFLKERNIPRVNLIGHSLGGKIAIHFTLKHPEQVDSLVVEDMRPNGATEKSVLRVRTYFMILEEALKAVPENSSEDEAKAAIAQYIYEKLSEVRDSAEGNFEELVTLRFVEGKWQYKMNFEVLKKMLENPEETLTPSSGLYKGPTMFIYGDKSEFDVGGDESNIRKLFPQVKMVPVAGAGHIIHAIHREFVDEVVKFLNNI